MIDRVYLSPFPGRFFQPDGQLTSALPPGQAPLMPTAADLADLFAGYNGEQILSGESNWGELGLAGADLAGIGTEVRGAIELATEVATMASGYGAIITLGVELLKWMSKGDGSGSGTDPLLAALQRIDARLKRIENEQVAEFKLSRKSTLELLQGRSGTAMWNAQEYMALGRPQDTFSLNKMAIANFESQASAQTLVQNIDGAFGSARTTRSTSRRTQRRTTTAGCRTCRTTAHRCRTVSPGTTAGLSQQCCTSSAHG